ncbi:hypothetical protein D9758_001671 [Tetrapyrgos nigripes]|uniref:Uncharacterized protein n=1 Tax=Tetrapyrgos nigripes TaxID=182062 RepID=A0A8H5GYJ7_9AGAR|nr:hypothetical protein D9758_001671 [Tetrapyrgos nigripes]
MLPHADPSLLPKSWETYPDRSIFRIVQRQDEDEDEPDEDEPDEDESPVTRTRTSHHGSTTGASTGSGSVSTGQSSRLNASGTQTRGAQPTDSNGNQIEEGKHGSNKGAIAAGVILAILAILAAFGLVELRRRRRKRARRVFSVGLNPGRATKRADVESRSETLTPMLSSARTMYRDEPSTREINAVHMHGDQGMRSLETLRTLENPWPEPQPHTALDRNPSGRVVHRESLSSEKTHRSSLSPSEPAAVYSPVGKEQMSWIPEETGGEQPKVLPPLPMELPPAYDQDRRM